MREERMIVVDGISRTVVISDEREALLAADAAGRASVAVWNGDREEFLPSAFAVEDPADADGEFLERVVRRKLGLPWTIRETGRLLIREFAEEDSEQVPREECLGPGDEVFADREKLRAYIRCQYGISQYGIWAAVEKESGRLVGKIGFAPPEDGREGLELGYHIFRPWRRMGYGLDWLCRCTSGSERTTWPLCGWQKSWVFPEKWKKMVIFICFGRQKRRR